MMERRQFANYLRENSRVKDHAPFTEIQGACSAKLKKRRAIKRVAKIVRPIRKEDYSRVTSSSSLSPTSGVIGNNNTYFTSANSGTLHKKCSILSRARVHAVDQVSGSNRKRRTRSSLWRCK